MASIATLSVSLVAKTGKFTSNMRKARRPVRRFSKGIDVASRKLLRFTGLLAAAATGGGLIILAKNAFTAIDALAKTSDKLGIATEDLAAMGIAAERSGVPIAQMQMGIQRMTRRMSEAARDTGEAKAAIKELGLEAKALNRLSPAGQFLEIAKAMEKVTNQADRVRLGFKLFDSEGVALINTLALGQEGLEKAFADAERFGLALSRIDAAKVEQANDSFTDIQNIIKGATFQLAIKLAPALTVMVEKLVEGGLAGEKMGDKIDKAAKLSFEGMATMVAMTDLIRDGVVRVIKGFQIFPAAVDVAAAAVSRFTANFLEGVNVGIGQLERLPGRVDAAAADIKRELDALTTKGADAIGIGEFFRETEKALEDFNKAMNKIADSTFNVFSDKPAKFAIDTLGIEDAAARIDKIPGDLQAALKKASNGLAIKETVKKWADASREGAEESARLAQERISKLLRDIGGDARSDRETGFRVRIKTLLDEIKKASEERFNTERATTGEMEKQASLLDKLKGIGEFAQGKVALLALNGIAARQRAERVTRQPERQAIERQAAMGPPDALNKIAENIKQSVGRQEVFAGEAFTKIANEVKRMVDIIASLGKGREEGLGFIEQGRADRARQAEAQQRAIQEARARPQGVTPGPRGVQIVKDNQLSATNRILTNISMNLANMTARAG